MVFGYPLTSKKPFIETPLGVGPGTISHQVSGFVPDLLDQRNSAKRIWVAEAESA